MNQADKANRRTLEKIGRQDEAADAGAYDTWFRQRVREAQNDPRPAVAGKTVERRFAGLRATARRKSTSRAR
jgi:hypothetical protein